MIPTVEGKSVHGALERDGSEWLAKLERRGFGRRFLDQFLCSTEGRFFVPTCISPVTPRADAVKDGRRPPPEAARSVLDGGEHGVTLALVGTAPGVVVGFTQAFHAGIASSRLLRVLTTVGGIGGGFVQPGPGRREAAEPAAES